VTGMIRLGRFGAVAILAGVGLALLGVQREMYPFAAVTGVASLLLSALGFYLSRHPTSDQILPPE
jgi:putative Mn2+ efflux pump MntP